MRRNRRSAGSGLLKAAESVSVDEDSAAAVPAPRRTKQKTAAGARETAGESSRSLCIIGVDPGLASTGWGVLEFSKGRLRYIAHGCIETGADLPRGERLTLLYKNILSVLKTYRPREAAMENLYFGRNKTSAMAVAEARGVLLLALSGWGLPVHELTPNDIKMAVTGVRRAEKSQVQEMVRFLLGLAEIPKPNHAADALGAAICAAHSGSLAGFGDKPNSLS